MKMTDNKTFGKTLLLSGGKTDIDFVSIYLKSHKFDTVVCADSGLETACKLDVKVDCFMGDFDSVSPGILDKYMNKLIKSSIDAQFIRYPAEIGATGGRIDHLLANIGILSKALENGVETYIIDSYNKIYLIDGETELHKDDIWSKYISFYPYTDEVKNLRLSGLKYELEGVDVIKGSSRTVSNEFAEGVDKAYVSFDSGILTVIQSKDK